MCKMRKTADCCWKFTGEVIIVHHESSQVGGITYLRRNLTTQVIPVQYDILYVGLRKKLDGNFSCELIVI